MTDSNASNEPRGPLGSPRPQPSGRRRLYARGLLRTWPAFSFALTGLFLVLAIGWSNPDFGHDPSNDVLPIHFRALDAPPVPPPRSTSVLTVKPGDTMETILVAGGLSRTEALGMVSEFAKTVDPRRLMPGEIFFFDHAPNGEVSEVRMKVRGWGNVHATRGHGGFVVESLPGEEIIEPVLLSAEIRSSLWDAIQGTGESGLLVQPLVDVFQWDIDFFRLQKGDWFSVVVDKKFVGNDLIGYGPVHAARFHHSGRTYEAYRFEPPGGEPAAYYTSEGKPVQKQFLRAPLRFSRVTSGFTNRRYHPVLKTFRAHPAIDYGAPTGTPVMTTASGVVGFAGRGKGEGNYIRIRHTGGYETYYLHLSRFAKGIRNGVGVVQGQIIGYVGSTGLASGPHLDYRVKLNGKYLNPLKLKSVSPDPLTGSVLAAFREQLTGHLAALEEADARLARTVEEDDSSRS